MRIGVISDTHNRLEAIAEAVRRMAEEQVELILHCGDIESVAAVQAFRGIPTYFAFGNWDRHRKALLAAIRDIGGAAYEQFGTIEIAGKRIAWLHSHIRKHLQQLEHADYFDYVFYGHTHLREQHRTGRTLVANPGALFRAHPKTCIVVEVVSGEIRPLIIGASQAGVAEASPSPPVPRLPAPPQPLMLPPFAASPAAAFALPPADNTPPLAASDGQPS